MKKAAKKKPTDHRPRVAAHRRALMRRKLVESALLVFAEQGAEASVIEDVIAAAAVSRGTFYNYFHTNAELLVAAIEELGNEVVDTIEARVLVEPSPSARLVIGLRLYFATARQFSLFARFIAPFGPSGDRPRQSHQQIHSDPHRQGHRSRRIGGDADHRGAGYDCQYGAGRGHADRSERSRTVPISTN